LPEPCNPAKALKLQRTKEGKIEFNIMEWQPEERYTINEQCVTLFHIIHKIIIINTDRGVSAHSTFDCESELISLLQHDWLWQITTPNFWTLHAK
jgi:hypothetical protein